MNTPRVTWLPPQQQTHSAPRFDRVQFDDRSRFLKDSGIAFNDLAHLSVKRVTDLRNGRRLPVPSWVTSDEQFRTVILKILENRFLIPISARTGTLKERLDRCRAAAKRLAATKRHCLDTHIQQFRALSNNRLDELSSSNYERLFLEALRGAGATARLNALEKAIRTLDGEICTTERAPELLTAVLFHFFRLGHSSPTVAETLGLTPWQVRQIIFRARRVAERATPSSRRCKMNRSKAEEIRRLDKDGMPWEQIAAKFGAVRETVRDAVRCKTWQTRRRHRG
jgi:hypothetical protein